MQKNSNTVSLIAVTLFFLFFGYYSFTGYFLPKSAGPDHQLSIKAVDFYIQQKRLAVMPQDQPLIHFSKYGSARAMRPPLGFASAAIVAKISPFYDVNWRYSYRHTSALFCALAVMLVFLGLMLYFQQIWLALLGSLLVALMPQFTFTGSYLNDDASAIFAATYLFYAMIYILKRGVGYKGLAHFGLSVGLVLLSKKTAWLILPSAMLFYLIYVLRFNRNTIKYTLWTGLFFIIGGGWWCLWNMGHYGINDPFLLNVESGWSDTYALVDLAKLGFAKQGIGFYDLLLHNYKGFLYVTYQAVIGHIDWLKLRMDSLQYNYYLVFLVLALVYLVSHVFTVLKTVLGKQSWLQLFSTTCSQSASKWVVDIRFECVIVFMVLFQLLMYTWHNIHNDIQIQGKYLLPVVFPVFVLSLSFFAKMAQICNQYWPDLDAKYRLGLVLLMLMLPFIVHADAIFDVVIPFYGPRLFAQ